MTSIKTVFNNLKAQGDGALIGYITAGDPKPEYTPKIAQALIDGGVDILELGLPFSDPIADGPTIQEASRRALEAGTTPRIVLELAKQIKHDFEVPIVIMTYFNPVFKTGLKKFFSEAKECRINGIIIPDLPVEEADDYRKIATSYDIDTIFLAAPSTKGTRIQKIVEYSSGFLYLVSHFGVTGTLSTIQDSTIQLVKKFVPFTKGRIPLAVGFGISKPEHIKSIIAAGADGVVVGSAFVNAVGRNLLNLDNMLAEIEAMTNDLKKATLH